MNARRIVVAISVPTLLAFSIDGAVAREHVPLTTADTIYGEVRLGNGSRADELVRNAVAVVEEALLEQQRRADRDWMFQGHLLEVGRFSGHAHEDVRSANREFALYSMLYSDRADRDW